MKYYDELQRRTVCHQILVKPWGKRGNGSFCPLTDYTLSCRPGWFISYCTTYISITNWFFESQICHLKYTWNLIWNLEVWYMPKFCDTVAGWFIVQDSLLILVFGELEDLQQILIISISNVSILQYFYGALPDLFLITDRC